MNLKSHPLAIADYLLDCGVSLVIIGGHAVNPAVIKPVLSKLQKGTDYVATNTTNVRIES